MTPVKTQPRYKCDFCKKRSVKAVMKLHEKRCFRNPNRFCDNCGNRGFTMEETIEGYPDQKVDCIYCSQFDKKKLEDIEAWEKKHEKVDVLHVKDIEIPF